MSTAKKKGAALSPIELEKGLGGEQNEALTQAHQNLPSTGMRCSPTIRDIARALGLPEDTCPEFIKERGRKFLSQESNHTATFVRHAYPALEGEARRAMEDVQQARQKKDLQSADYVKAKFPMIEYAANDYEVDELVRSEPGHPEPKKWTTGVFARALQLPEDTITKYARGDSKHKSKALKRAAQRKRK